MQLALKKNTETGMQEQGLGRSKKGGVANYMLRATLFVTAGQRSDYIKALELIDGQVMSVLIADKGYDANYMPDAAKCVEAEVVIPGRSQKKTQEIMIKSYIIKHFRRVATRYDKLDIAYLAFTFLAGIYLRLK